MQQQHRGEIKPKPVDKYQIAKARVICGGLIIISVYFMQEFLGIGVFTPPPSKALDWIALASVLAFAVALPLLVVRVLFTFEEEPRIKTIEHKRDLKLVYNIGIISASLGVFFAFLHIHWLAGLVVLVSMSFGLYVYASYTKKLKDLKEGTSEE